VRLQDKVSIVTGAGDGIGKAIASAFSHEGSVVAVNDIRGDRAKATAQMIIARGGRALAIKGDVSNRQDVRNIVARTVKSFGQIDILVNNAGTQTEKPFLNLSEEEWDRVIDTNLKGTFLCSQSVAKEMIKRNSGKIINISSIHESVPRANIAHYAASKGGILMLTKVMALELARYKINVNCIAPGAIATTMNAKLLNSRTELSKINSRIPCARMGKPEEIAALAVFLGSKDADYITGASFCADGGLTLMRL